jgi:predicted ester cyclase
VRASAKLPVFLSMLSGSATASVSPAMRRRVSAILPRYRRVAEVLANDVVFEVPGGLRGQGKASCIEFYGSWFGTFSDAHVDVHCLHIIGDVAVEAGTFTGTHNGVLKGPMGEVPPTGRPIRIAYIQVLRFRDGKHVSFNLMFDRLSMLEQLGVRHLGQARRMSSVRRSSP